MAKFYGNYEGLDERRKQEREDSEMMSKMVAGHANMPQEVIMKAYPKNNSNMSANLDDTISGIDSQIREDDSKRNSKMKPKKV